MGDSLRDDSWSIGKGMTMNILQNPLRVHLHITGEEPFIVPRHWHLCQTEQHVVLKGRVQIAQDSVTRILRPEDGVCTTPAGVVHSIQTFPGEETIIEETTLPSTEQKVIFFRNLFAPGVAQSFLAVMQLFYYGDGYPELPFRSRWLEWLMVVVVGGWISPFFGYQIPDKRLHLDPKRFPPSKKD
ncbi:hypothetical protein B0H13DRAFT_1641833 [Mycena leptocephala]|nr:hypothetical protein B0H13DRAFT_1641833 [Mycena leptocephala]